MRGNGVDGGPMIVQLPEHAESSRDLHTLLLDYISRVLKLLLIKYTHAWNLKNIELVIGNHNTLVLQTEILEMYSGYVNGMYHDKQQYLVLVSLY